MRLVKPLQFLYTIMPYEADLKIIYASSTAEDLKAKVKVIAEEIRELQIELDYIQELSAIRERNGE